MRALALLCLLIPVLGCRPEPAVAPRPPIVVLSIDTLRSDHLAIYGDTRVPTPAIDALARDGIVYERAFSEVPLTLPSHVSLFSGALPPVHGVRDNVGFPVDPQKAPLLQSRLKTLGYTTMGVVSAQVLGQRTGFAQDFDRWDEPRSDGDGSLSLTAERAGSVAVAMVRQWLAQPPAQPLFLFAHLYEPHMPYRPPEPWLGRFGATYEAEIATADALVGNILEELRRRGMYDEALVILVSDHGEGLGDHGEDEHGLLLYREALQVPLVVKLPKQQRAGERVARPVGLVDVVPTVLELLQQPFVGEGVSLLAVETPQRVLYAETMYPLLHFGWSDLAAAISGDYHLIDGPRPELYNFATDPGERNDLVADPGVDRRTLAAMRAYLGGIDRSIAAPEEVEAETIATLGALGYLGQPTLPSDRSNLANPADQVASVRPLLLGIRLFHEGALEEAAVALNEAAKVEALRSHALQFLGQTYDALGRKEDALAAYQQGAATGSSAFLSETAARRLLEMGRSEAALEMLEVEMARHPQVAILPVLASRALLQLGQVDAARVAADRAITLDPTLGDAFYQRGVVAIAQRDGAAALPDLIQAAALDRRHLGARKALAMLRYAQGDLPEAQRLLEEVLTIDPKDPDARADLATIASEARGASR